MPFGYQNRISPTYWTSAQLGWSGSAWVSGGSISSCTLVPTAALELPVVEIRVVIKLGGVKKIWWYDDTTFLGMYVGSGLSNERYVLRLTSLATSMRLDFDAMSAVQISEIELGLSGAH